jgi:histidinol-phosphatase (PHP family)
VIDFHIHSDHSADAQGSLQEYCERALATGLEEVCFTNHCEIDPQRRDNLIRFGGNTLPITNERIRKLRNEVNAVRSQYAHRGLEVRFGLEVGYFTGVRARLSEITHGIELDYLLAGVHCLDHVCIDSSREYEGYFSITPLNDLLVRYFDAVKELVQTGLFDAVAHFDVYKKYGLAFYGEDVKACPEEMVRGIFRLMAEKGTALEINTAGLRRHKEFYPDAAIMRLARSSGVEMLTVGSDCHKPDDLGRGIREAVEYARSFGFDAVYGFANRKPVRIGI